MRRISILGSTGSIGTQALQVVTNLPGEFQVVALTARRNTALLAEQARRFQAKAVALAESDSIRELREQLSNTDIEVLAGMEGVLEIAARDDVDICLNALVGGVGMAPTVAALKSGVDVALSNKESLVMAGELITTLVHQNDLHLYPVDSEHSAVWQCLAGEQHERIRTLFLTGSGGPFRTWSREQLIAVTKAQALKHPNWEMGPKITVDSATMMNKGLEVIEACWLFDLQPEQVKILIHPQSIVHSLIEFSDGSVKAQLGVPDMKIPIQYALTYPERKTSDWPRLDLLDVGELTFEKPDTQKFPSIDLAYQAIKQGGSAPAALNAANDMAVQAFLDDRISFVDIPTLVEKAMSDHPTVKQPALEDIEEVQGWVHRYIEQQLS